jgi:hypothetical protein
MVCGKLACHSCETGKTRKADHNFINNCSENTRGLDVVYSVSLITENMEIEAISLSDKRSRISTEAFWRLFTVTKGGGHPAVMRLGAHLENGANVYF